MTKDETKAGKALAELERRSEACRQAEANLETLREQRNRALVAARAAGVTGTQMEKATGMTRGMVYRILKEGTNGYQD